VEQANYATNYSAEVLEIGSVTSLGGGAVARAGSRFWNIRVYGGTASGEWSIEDLRKFPDVVGFKGPVGGAAASSSALTVRHPSGPWAVSAAIRPASSPTIIGPIVSHETHPLVAMSVRGSTLRVYLSNNDTFIDDQDVISSDVVMDELVLNTLEADQVVGSGPTRVLKSFDLYEDVAFDEGAISDVGVTINGSFGILDPYSRTGMRTVDTVVVDLSSPWAVSVDVRRPEGTPPPDVVLIESGANSVELFSGIVTITPGLYEPLDLVADLNAQFVAIGGGTIVMSYDAPTQKLTCDSSASRTILGDLAFVQDVLGFDSPNSLRTQSRARRLLGCRAQGIARPPHSFSRQAMIQC
jgi:hypothetical protein